MSLIRLSFILIFLISSTKCDKSSLAFVIDDTRSMTDDIDAVKEGADQILSIKLDKKSSQIENFILVTVNDPPVLDVHTITKDANEFRRALHSLYTHNDYNRDCMEPSLIGIELALKNSLPGSEVFVFTDASAKDYHMSKIVMNLCQKKQSRVTFVLTGTCGAQRHNVHVKVFYDIAAACSGEVFKINKKDIPQLFPYFRENNEGSKTILTSKTVPPKTWTNIDFMVDDKAEYVLISVSGEKVKLNGPTPDTNIKRITWLSNVKVLKLINPKPGAYNIRVKSATSASVIAFARTDFTFIHGFSELKPKSMKDTTAQPIKGIKSHLSVFVRDVEHSVQIKAVQILDMNENLIKEVPLMNISRDLYTTDTQLWPVDRFKIAVIGTGNFGHRIRRIAKTPVEPQKPKDPDSKTPVVSIAEGTVTNVAYNGILTLTCRVSAYPPPNIVWEDSKGNKLLANNFTLEPPYEYRSILNLQNIKTTNKYSCYARNHRGKSAVKTIAVTVDSPFVVNDDHISGKTKIKYGNVGILKCNIESKLPMQITWKFYNHVIKNWEIIRSNAKYTIFADDTLLKINSMDFDAEGPYTCQATLTDDGYKSPTYKTDIEITGIFKPKLEKESSVIKVMENNSVVISCRTTAGIPKPNIQLQFKRANANEYVYRELDNNEIRIKAALSDTGYYKCIAENVMGWDEQKHELIVNVPPIITTVKSDFYAVENDVALQLPCETTGNPKPVLSWKKNGVIITSDTKYKMSEDGHLIINKLVRKDTDTYSCTASNEFGTAEKNYTVKVKGKPKLEKESSVTKAMENDSVVISCRTTAGIPKPNVQLQFKRANTNKYVDRELDNGEIRIKAALSDTGYYKCVAENAMGWDEQIHELIVNAPPIITTVKSDFYAVENNIALRLPCETRGNPKPILSWKRNGVIITSDTKYKISDDGHLIINKLVRKDTDTYSCTASNEFGTAEKNYTVTVKGKPKLEKKSSVIKAMENDSVVISCRTTAGIPKPNVQLQFKRANTNEYVDRELDNGEIRIKAALSDTGYYKCVVENAMGWDQQIHELIVNAPPIITTVKSDFYAVENDIALRLPCETTGNPKPILSWKRNGVIITSDTKYKISDDRHLIINKVVRKDTDTYSCTASNEFGTAEKNYTVTVKEYLDDETYGNTSDVFEVIDKPLKLECSLPINDKDKVEWYLNGLDMNIGNRFIHFSKPNVSHDGNYTCRVSNEKGSVSETYNVDFGYSPKFRTDDDIPVALLTVNWNGEDESLSCDANAKPKAEALWMYNGNKVGDSSLRLMITGWGSYSCLVTNVHGSIQRNFTVTSKNCLIQKETKLNKMPLIITESSSWPNFEERPKSLQISREQNLQMLCTSDSKQNNNFKSFNKFHVNAVCDHEDRFLIEGRSYKFSDLQCDNEVMPTINKTGVNCLNENTELISVGFNVAGLTNIYAYEVCLDKARNIPLYTKLISSGFNMRDDNHTMKWYNEKDISNNAFDKAYNCSQITEYHDSSSCCYAKKQLVNSNYVTYGPAQRATYINQLNAIPVWIPCHESTRTNTWSLIDSTINFNGQIWSGVHKIENINGSLIPRYLWKVMLSGAEYMTVVYVNSPAPTDKDILCPNICDDDTRSKTIYCCEMDDFLKTFDLPLDIFQVPDNDYEDLLINDPTY